MFEEAVRNKYRFVSNVGSLSVEDLWDLSAPQLDDIYKRLNGELKKVTEDSLLNTTSDADRIVENKLAIVKHVFTTKMVEADEKLQIKERKQKKQYLLSLLQQKQDETYKSKSAEELQALINEL